MARRTAEYAGITFVWKEEHGAYFQDPWKEAEDTLYAAAKADGSPDWESLGQIDTSYYIAAGEQCAAQCRICQSEYLRDLAQQQLDAAARLEEEHAAWWATVDRGSYLEEQEEPLWAYLESCLDVVRIETVRGDRRELRGWELLLCAGGPSAGLELDADGRARVWAAWWSAPEYVEGRLEWLAQQLEELAL